MSADLGPRRSVAAELLVGGAYTGHSGRMRALVVTQPGDGHLNPLVPVARALVDAGHEVLAATSPSYVEDVERTELAAVGIGPPYRWDAAIDMWPDGADVSGEDSPLFWFQRVQRDITVPFVRGLCELVRQDRPDLLIAEWSVATWGQALRDLEGVPFVATGWAIEPGHEDEFVGLEEGGANQARAVLGPSAHRRCGSGGVDLVHPPSWAAFDGPAAAEHPPGPPALPAIGGSRSWLVGRRALRVCHPRHGLLHDAPAAQNVHRGDRYR